MKQLISTDKWDAELNTNVCDAYNNADLTIKLRLGFRQINPSGGAASGTYHDYGDSSEPTRKIIKWSKGAWVNWIDNFVKSARKYWHGKFWLVNNFPIHEFEAKKVRYRPNIWCRCEISAVHVDPTIYGPWNIHHMIDVVRLDSTETWFGSHAKLYDSRDTRLVQKNTDSKGNPVMQRAHVHEVGHLLGLGHVDEGKAHCPVGGNTNAKVCYGVADKDMKNVMGSGMARTPDLANPWRRAIIQCTSRGNIATQTDWESKMRRHYPRTMADVAAGRHITSRPSRG